MSSSGFCHFTQKRGRRKDTAHLLTFAFKRFSPSIFATSILWHWKMPTATDIEGVTKKTLQFFSIMFLPKKSFSFNIILHFCPWCFYVYFLLRIIKRSFEFVFKNSRWKNRIVLKQQWLPDDLVNAWFVFFVCAV